MVGAATFTEVKCCYRLVLCESCMAQDISPQFTSRGEYIGLRDPHFWKMLQLKYHSKIHLKFRTSKYKYFCSAPQGLVKLQSRSYKIIGSNSAPNQSSISLDYTSDSSGATSVLCQFKREHNLASCAKCWINTRQSSLGGSHAGFVHPILQVAQRSPPLAESAEWWLVPGGIAPAGNLCAGGTQGWML